MVNLFGGEEIERAQKDLGKAVKDMGVFYVALRNLLLDLKSLDDKDVNKLLEKYKVEVE